jgi:hypothetical protein
MRKSNDNEYIFTYFEDIVSSGRPYRHDSSLASFRKIVESILKIENRDLNVEFGHVSMR